MNCERCGQPKKEIVLFPARSWECVNEDCRTGRLTMELYLIKFKGGVCSEMGIEPPVLGEGEELLGHITVPKAALDKMLEYHDRWGGRMVYHKHYTIPGGFIEGLVRRGEEQRAKKYNLRRQ